MFGNSKDQTVSLCDFQKLPLSGNWYYKLNAKGEGLKIRFPARITRRLVLKPIWVKCKDGLLQKKLVPLERMKFICAVSACSVETV